VLGAAWVVALAVVVSIALARRPDDVGTNDGAGLAIIVVTLPAIAFAVWRPRLPVVATLTMVVGAIATCVTGWSVLFDRHSTAAVGIVGVPFDAVAVVVAGIFVGYVIGRVLGLET
jgi:hypothetical protein